MNKIYKLFNQMKHYEWGSAEILPQFLNKENNKGLPFAEMWMGTHIGGSSKINPDNSNAENLAPLSGVSGDLPFLFKLLAIDKPLSIQAHPNKEQAEEGFKREESLRLSIKAPTRNYKDDNHKPEIICALTPFSMMAGFREPEIIRKLLKEFIMVMPQLKEVITPLINSLASGQLTDFFKALFKISEYEKEYLCSIINRNDNKIQSGSIPDEEWNLIKYFCDLYPNDTAILSPLYLNYLELQPGQAVYIPAGILHAYLKGFGVELMSNSDNVLRGGLTPKHVDINELLKILHFVPFNPQIITPSESASWYCYHTPCGEFELACMNGGQTFPGNTPAICVVTEGELKADGEIFKRGESFFIPKDSQPLSFSGNYRLYAACTPHEK